MAVRVTMLLLHDYWRPIATPVWLHLGSTEPSVKSYRDLARQRLEV